MGQVWRMYLHCVDGIGLALRKRLALCLAYFESQTAIRRATGGLIVHPRKLREIVDEG
jgi:hypothetical protein